MENTRKKVFSGTSQVQAMGFKNALVEAGIRPFEIDKMDSAYSGIFGDIQIYVNTEDEMEALAILKKLAY